MRRACRGWANSVGEHLRRADRQATSASSRFLEAVRQFNRGGLDQNTLVRKTVALGFQNVIDAFHVVNSGPIKTQVFLDERKQRGDIVVTDELLKLKETPQFPNLSKPRRVGGWSRRPAVLVSTQPSFQ
jgi:hypothetical protein